MASNNRFRQGGVLLLALGLLGGCAQVSYDRVHLDSPMPFEARDLVPCQGVLKGGASCLAMVRADQWFTDTGLTVGAGERYRISVPACQFWYDKDRLNVPPKGEAGSGLMNLFTGLKRHDTEWFSLMATVLDSSGEPVEPVFDLGRSEADVVIMPKSAGKLAMYPNDARSTNGDQDYFYRNNHGQAWVMVTHCGPSCPPLSPALDRLKTSCPPRTGKAQKKD